MNNRHLLCFIDDIRDEDAFEAFIAPIEAAGYQIHVLNGVNANAIQPHHVLAILGNIFDADDEGRELYFLSNIREFLMHMFRLYPDVFRHFIFYATETASYLVKQEPVYAQILAAELEETEQIRKPVFMDNAASDADGWFNARMRLMNGPDDLEATYERRDNAVYYYFNGTYYLFQPAPRGEKSIVNLSDGRAPADPPHCYNTSIGGDNWLQAETMNMLQRLDRSKSYFLEGEHRISQHFAGTLDRIRTEREYNRLYMLTALDLAVDSFTGYARTYLLSFLMFADANPRHLDRLLQTLLADQSFSAEERYFYLWQCIRARFVNTVAASADADLLIRQVYRSIFNEFHAVLKEEYSFLPSSQRDSECVLVITGQFLGMGHAPTKTALDRCYSLINHLGKEVVLLNSREVMTTRERSPFYSATLGNVIADFNGSRNLAYKDANIPYYQSAVEMPDLSEIRKFMNFVREKKPAYIISIGGPNLTADLCSLLAPVAAIATVFSGLPLTESQLHVTGRKVNEADLSMLAAFGFNRGNVIESLFTFDFKPQEHHYTRQELNLPEDKFLIAVVGARLDYEVTAEFAHTILDSHPQVHLVFIGPFSAIDERVEQIPGLRERSTALGFQSDVLAVLELCDLYANPSRAGGGSSASEALSKGVPVVALRHGDVGVAVGDAFTVASYEDMSSAIHRYAEDRGYYDEMSEKARERAALLLSTDVQFEHIVHQIMNSPYYG